MTTPILGLAELLPSQNMKYLTVNQVFNYVDALVNLTVFNRTQTSAPGSPSAGDRYIVASPATGDFAGQENNIAVYIGTQWVFFTPSEGWRASDQGADERIEYDGSSWAAVTGSSLVASTANGASSGFFIIDEELTGLTGATVETTIVIPNPCIVMNVSIYVTGTITGATSFDVGVVGNTSQFGGSIGVSAGSANVGIIGPSGFYSNTPIRLTANGSNFTGGSVRVAIHYYEAQASSS